MHECAFLYRPTLFSFEAKKELHQHHFHVVDGRVAFTTAALIIVLSVFNGLGVLLLRIVHHL